MTTARPTLTLVEFLTARLDAEESLARGTLEYGRQRPAANSSPEYCETLRALAAVYADHPDYRADWNDPT